MTVIHDKLTSEDINTWAAKSALTLVSEILVFVFGDTASPDGIR